MKKIQTALISVFNKVNLVPVLRVLEEYNVDIVSTGGTYDYIKTYGYKNTYSSEEFTGMPPILGGRVKTLHPKIFGGILYRRDDFQDSEDIKSHEIRPIDLVIVDLYPFHDAVTEGESKAEIIEKIDIGGVSLLRAAAKNYKDVVSVPSRHHYDDLIKTMKNSEGHTSEESRQYFAKETFEVTTSYDWYISKWFKGNR